MVKFTTTTVTVNGITEYWYIFDIGMGEYQFNEIPVKQNTGITIEIPV